MQLLASLTRCFQFALSLAILVISLGFLQSPSYLASPYLEATTGAFGIFTTAVGALLICMHDLPRQIAWTLDILAGLIFLACGIFYVINIEFLKMSHFQRSMRQICIAVSFAGFAAYTVSIVHSCLVNRRRKTPPKVVEEGLEFSDNSHTRTELLGHLHDKAELPSDGVARIYELHGHNVVELGGRVFVTHEIHSTPLAELPGDTRI